MRYYKKILSTIKYVIRLLEIKEIFINLIRIYSMLILIYLLIKEIYLKTVMEKLLFPFSNQIKSR